MWKALRGTCSTKINFKHRQNKMQQLIAASLLAGLISKLAQQQRTVECFIVLIF